MEAFFREACHEDCHELAPNLRPLDLRELHINSDGSTSEEALIRCIEVSDEANAIILEGECVGLFGVSPLPNGSGAPWLLCSEALSNVPLKLYKQGRRWLSVMLRKYQHLGNVCLYEHEQSKNFIERMGFRFKDVMEINGETFQFFEMRWEWRNQ